MGLLFFPLSHSPIFKGRIVVYAPLIRHKSCMWFHSGLGLYIQSCDSEPPYKRATSQFSLSLWRCAWEKSRQRERQKEHVCVGVHLWICACVSDPPQAKALLMISKWLWEVNKQTEAAATTSHQTAVTRTSGWLQTRKHIIPRTLEHKWWLLGKQLRVKEIETEQGDKLKGARGEIK